MQFQLPLNDRLDGGLDSDVQALVNWLAERDSWTTARQIRDVLGHCDRTIRRLASDSAGLIVSGPGCPGYKYIGRATSEEIRHTVQRLDHQASVMLTRAREIRHQAHSRI